MAVLHRLNQSASLLLSAPSIIHCMSKKTLVAVSSALLLGSSGCGTAATARALRTEPVSERLAEKCPKADGRSEPYVVTWDGPQRARFEGLARRNGVVVVAYEDCRLQVMSQCRAPGAYRYSGTERKTDIEKIHDADELYAKLPLGAVQLEDTLARSGELAVDWTVVGTFEAERAYRESDLQGVCQGATHVVTGLTVGAFEFSTASSARIDGHVGLPVGGLGGNQSSERSVLTSDGLRAACDNASLDDPAPPSGCGALIRIALEPLPEVFRRQEQALRESRTLYEGERSSARARRGWGYGLTVTSLVAGGLATTFALLGSHQNDKIREGGFATGSEIEDAGATGATYNGLAFGFGIGAGALFAIGLPLILFSDEPIPPHARDSAALGEVRR
jgi:hypothetical protein